MAGVALASRLPTGGAWSLTGSRLTGERADRLSRSAAAGPATHNLILAAPERLARGWPRAKGTWILRWIGPGCLIDSFLSGHSDILPGRGTCPDPVLPSPDVAAARSNHSWFYCQLCNLGGRLWNFHAPCNVQIEEKQPANNRTSFGGWLHPQLLQSNLEPGWIQIGLVDL
jgi:hypothetical protein